MNVQFSKIERLSYQIDYKGPLPEPFRFDTVKIERPFTQSIKELFDLEINTREAFISETGMHSQ